MNFDFETILGDGPLACLIVSLPGLQILKSNKSAQRLLAPLSSANLSQLFPKEDLARFTDQLGKENSYRNAWRFKREAAEELELEIFSQRLSSTSPASAVLFFNDISARRKAMQALRESEEGYRRMVELSPDATVVTVDGRIAFANMACEKLLQVDGPEDLIGQDWIRFLDPQEHASTLARWKSMVELNQQSELIEQKLRTKCGRWVDVEIREFSFSYQGSTALQILIRDVTQRKMMEKALKESEERYKQLVDVGFDGVAIYRDGLIQDANRAFEKIFGYEAGEMNGLDLRKLLSREDADTGVDALLAAGTAEPCEMMAQKKDSIRTPIEFCSKTCFFGGAQAFIAAIRDISERKKNEETIRQQAYYDTLTGLPNRILFRDRLSQAVKQGKRDENKFAVMFLDLDRFKIINDTLGHSFGDLLLQQVAQRLTDCLRKGDTACRLGGDEFTLLLSSIRHPEDAGLVAQKILESLNQPFYVHSHELHVTSSIGISIFPDDGQEVDDLLKKADAAMYRAKERGRNGFQIYQASLESKAIRRMELESKLHRALDRGEFVLHYQPVLDLKSGKISGAEALLRWKQPQGLVLPDEFISIAEETRLILPIGEWVLETACQQAREWLKGGLQKIKISVNVSAHQFQKRSLIDKILKVLRDTSLNPTSLDLEITEDTAMINPSYSLAMLEDLVTMGIQVSLDDFGKGYSSLSYLKRFPIHTLKIDQNFILDVHHHHKDAAIVSASIRLAHDLQLKVVAEGVENRSQLEFLQSQGCDMIQGFLFARPLPAPAFAELSRSNQFKVDNLGLGHENKKPLIKNERLD